MLLSAAAGGRLGGALPQLLLPALSCCRGWLAAGSVAGGLSAPRRFASEHKPEQHSIYITDVGNNVTSHTPLLLGLLNYFERHLPYVSVV